MPFRRSAPDRRKPWSWRCIRVLCALVLLVSIITPLPVMQAASSAVGFFIAAVAPPLQDKSHQPAQEEVKRDAPRHSSPNRTQAPRITIIAREKHDVPFTISLISVIVVSPEIATAQIKNSNVLTLIGVKAGETILIASDGRRRYTFLLEVVGRSYSTTGRATPSAEQCAIEQGGFSGSIALSFSAPLGGSPALLRQSFEIRRTLSPGRTLRLSGEMFEFFGQGEREVIHATTPGLGLNRLSLGLDTPDGSLDILDSQVNISPLSLNNFTMRGFHLVSTRGSRLRGVELFAGIARPSLSLLDDSHGWVAGLVLPLAQGETWRVRAGVMAVSPQRGNGVGNGGTIWHIDGSYAPSGNIKVEGEAAYANGGLSWRARLDLRRGPFRAYGEIVRLDGRSPLVSICAQPGERNTEAFVFQWRPTARLNASVSYNHTAIALPATALLRAPLDRTTFLATADYQLSPNSRLGFRFTQQRIETNMPGGDSRFQLEIRTAAINHNIRFKRSWANTFEARLNLSRESRAGTETDRGFSFSEQLRFSWRRGSATGFVNYTRKTPSLAGLIVRNPRLLPPLLQLAFAADPARFLQTHRDALTELIPGVELPQTRNLNAGIRLQAAFSRFNLTGEVRYSTGEILARNQRSLAASFSASVRLDAANSVQVSGSRSFATEGAGGQSALTVSYVHRFGAGSGGGLQFSKLLGLDRGLIQGRVFFDTNGNGREDEGESGMPGMRVQIDGDRSAMTDSSGHFRFRINPGQYSVALISGDLGVRLRASTLTEQQVSLFSRQTVNLSFGVSNFGTISGRVFNDTFLTGDPTIANMPGVSGVQLILHPEVGGSGSAATGTLDASGSYEFRNLRPGSYILEIDLSTLPANFRLPAQASWHVTVEPLQGFYLDIPLAAQRAISGIVFIDRNGDGEFDQQMDEVVQGARGTAGRVETVAGFRGSYLLRNLPAGIIEIYARAPGGVQSGGFNVELGAEPPTRRKINLKVTR